MMTMMTVIDNVVDHYTYQTRWGQKRTHANESMDGTCSDYRSGVHVSLTFANPSEGV